MSTEERLRELIREELAICCETSLPRLNALVATDEGKSTAEDLIYKICATEGISVQAAMAQYDSEL